MGDSYDSFQVGDPVFFVENRWMAFCRIKKIIRDRSRPNYAKYVLEIVRLPRENECFQPLNTILKHFSVSRTAGMYYSGMWHFYTPQEFEENYGDCQPVMINWARYVIPSLIALVTLASLFILTASGCCALFRSLLGFR